MIEANRGGRRSVEQSLALFRIEAAVDEQSIGESVGNAIGPGLLFDNAMRDRGDGRARVPCEDLDRAIKRSLRLLPGLFDARVATEREANQRQAGLRWLASQFYNCVIAGALLWWRCFHFFAVVFSY